MLKNYFPFAFNPKPNLKALGIHLLVHIIIGAIAGFLVGLLSVIPLLTFVLGIAGALLGLYLLVSMVLTVLHYFGVLSYFTKDRTVCTEPVKLDNRQKGPLCRIITTQGVLLCRNENTHI